jgi:hypothetical protein
MFEGRRLSHRAALTPHEPPPKWRREGRTCPATCGLRIWAGHGRHDPKTVRALSRHAEFDQTWDTYAHPPLAVEGIKVTTFGSIFDPADLRPEAGPGSGGAV